VFGLGPFPALGVTGAAAALAISYILRAAVLAGYLLAGRSALTPRRRALNLRGDLFREILRVGLPGSVNTILTNLSVVALTGLVGSFGTFALAGYGLGVRLEYLQIPLVFGLGTALVTMVGTNVGAGKLDRARRTAWLGAALAGAITGSVGLLAAVMPIAWLRLFSEDAPVLEAGQAYLQIVGPTYGFFGFGLALYFASQGAGRLFWPLIAAVGRLAITVGGGWAAVAVLGVGLPWLFAAIALGFLSFGCAQAAAIERALPRSDKPEL
jgi:Na+-driven multidrug efflux pump